ncbi:MAG: transglycosylase SLT domain-containing protein [Pyrinomonadaceae bacterium]
MKRFLLIPFLLLFSLAKTTMAQAHELETAIQRSVLAREYPTAIADLKKLRTENEKLFRSGDYDYLMGRLAESNGDLALAAINYQATAMRDSQLNGYALKHLSQIARSTGNLMLERIYLTEIMLLSPDSFLARGAELRLARNSFESSNYGETIRILTKSSSVGTRQHIDPNVREMRSLLAESYLRSGQPDAARAIFSELINTFPNQEQPDDVALRAAKGLDILDGGDGRKAPELSEAEHIQRANIFQFNRDFADARLHFEAVIANYPNGANATEASFQIGRGLLQKPDNVEALKWFERVLEQYPNSAQAKDALLQAAAAYGRVGRSRESMNRYLSFIDKYPQDEKLDRAYLNIVDLLRDRGEDTEALKWCEKTREVFKGKMPEAVAIFAAARIHIARDDWAPALASLEHLSTFQNLGGTWVPGGTNIDEVTFLRGFAFENLKNYHRAIETYLLIPDGRGEYYGWRATERLQLLSRDEVARSFIVQSIGTYSVGLTAKDPESRRKSAQAILRLTDTADLREKALNVLKTAIQSLPKYQLPKNVGRPNLNPSEAGAKAEDAGRSTAEKLLSLNLYDEAAKEIAAKPGSLKFDGDDQAFALAELNRRGDRADRTMAFIESIWRRMPADFPIELIPRFQAEMLYPVPFADELLRIAPKYGVDPRLILAIMRQESRFQTDAKSFAAARGLMQFISTTSTRVAAELGRANFQQDDLYYSATSITFGAYYLADLFRMFPNQPDAVAASYNGGEDNMKRWLTRTRSNLPERYMSEILYSQSKDYVYKVMANYRMYQYLYDERLRPSGSVPPK